MNGKFFSAIILVFLLSMSIVKSEKWSYPVPGNIIPIRYKVHLTTNNESFYKSSSPAYLGRVEISMKAIQDNVRSISFHASDKYVFRDIILIYPDSLQEKFLRGNFLADTELYQIPLESPLPKDKVLTLIINFTNKYYDCSGRSCTGFFRIPEEKNSNTFLQITQGQFNSARYIFPCFDEPKYKSYFKISVSIPDSIHRMGYHALSNAKVEKIYKNYNETLYDFEETPVPMSTYLVALVISRLSRLPKKVLAYPHIHNPIEFNTYGKPDLLKNEKIRNMHELSPKYIERYTEMFKIAYTFKKLDQVVIEGFPVHGMENFGLTIYSPIILTWESEFYAYEAQAHEIAHQWIGNLVTLEDWTDIGFQESLAHYFAYTALDDVKNNIENLKSHEFTNEFIINRVLKNAKKDDAWPTAKSIRESYQYVFGERGYLNYAHRKGFAILRMLNLIYGEKIFSKAVRKYIQIFQTKNAKEEKFIECFDFAVNSSQSDEYKPSKLLSPWYENAGHPVINITKRYNAYYYLKQERFLFQINPDGNHSIDQQWYIPITFSTSQTPRFDRTEVEFWLKPNKISDITLIENPEWYIINHQMAGFYRVNYDSDNWNAIIKVLNNQTTFRQIPEFNRIQLLDDTINFAISYVKQKYMSFTTVADLYNYLRHEDSYHAWDLAFDSYSATNLFWFPCFDDKFGCQKFRKTICYVVQQKCDYYQAHPNQNSSYYSKKLKHLVKNIFYPKVKVLDNCISASCEIVESSKRLIT